MMYNVHVVNKDGKEVKGLAEGDSLFHLERNLKDWLGDDITLVTAHPQDHKKSGVIPDL